MVKVSFNSSLAQKDAKKDAQSLLPEDEDKVDAEAAVPIRHQSRAWCWCMCLGLALMLSGVVVGGAYLCHHYSTLQEEGQVFYCGVNYREEDFMVFEEEEVEVVETPFSLKQLEERIWVLEEEQVELINVPVPEFDNGDPADIVHDFQRMLTAYLDLSLNKCYVISLNTSIVMPPRDLLELLVNVKAGTYLPQSYVVHEEMIVTERIENVNQLGPFIYNLCRDKDTFRLQRRDRILGMQKREALDCHSIRHFENTFVVETKICSF